MRKKEFLMLADIYDEDRDSVYGWRMSEKLDGMRCFWDGGISRGEWASEVPWCNVEKDKKAVEATGLYSRYGKVIWAPDEWLDGLPGILLDGELVGGTWEETVSTVKRQDYSGDWDRVEYSVFDSPLVEQVFDDRELWGRRRDGIMEWVVERGVKEKGFTGKAFEDVYNKLRNLDLGRGRLIEQKVLSHSGVKLRGEIEDALTEVIGRGGEGLMLRCGWSRWEPRRSRNLLKVKVVLDSEATVLGFTEGKGKYLGLVGALLCEWADGTIFELSGMTDREREPGYFRVGEKISFKYRKVSQKGVPIEPRFYRKFIQ